jgi:subtilisin-like proprotein convertase family protein
MRSRKSHIRAVGAAILAVALALSLGTGTASAKKKKKAVRTASVTTQLNAPIPDGTDTAIGQLNSVATLGKKFKKKEIRDVNVTLQSTGSGPGSLDDLVVQLSAPDGSTTSLVRGLGGQSMGPITLDDETAISLGGPNPCPATILLCEPYQGTVRPGGGIFFADALSTMDGGRAKGAWTLTAFDQTTGDTNVLNFWTLTLKYGKPYAT